ncbi:unnamed protein product [Rotaria socialis]|uniref:HAT C-terminal dimerisation domain-containing protein n=1 Tax=Rotaria socialis TaxID=392032 RepID=A0A819AK19_9BILA|nr:unnamed protein product [Rotaria socialis]
MNEISKINKEQNCQPPKKKSKIQETILQLYEDDSDSERLIDDGNSSGSEDYSFQVPKVDELSRYLLMDIDKTTLSDNPLDFWRKHKTAFPVLSKFARQIHCISG